MLYFEDLTAIEGPCEQRAAADERVREMLTWPGVTYDGISPIFHTSIPSKTG